MGSLTPVELQAALSLGLVAPAMPLARAVETARGLPPELVAGILERHKVLVTATPRLAEAASDDPSWAEALLARVDVSRRALAARNAASDELLGRLEPFAAEHGVLVCLMKGAAMRDWYPVGLDRRVGDLDLWIPDVASAWKVAGMLHRLGYTWKTSELPWIKADGDQLYGQIGLTAPGAERLYVDIHIGAYSIRHCGTMPLERSLASQGPIARLADEDNVCSVVANIAGDWVVDGKTLNDVTLALARGLDLAYIRDTLDRGGLLGFLAVILDTVAEVCALDDEQLATSAALVDGVRREARPPLGGLPSAAHMRLRRRAVVRHAWEVGRRRSVMNAATNAATAHLAYSRTSTVRRVGWRPPRRVPLLEPRRCVRLVPLDIAAKDPAAAPPAAPLQLRRRLADNLRIAATARGDEVLIADGLAFAPTINFRLSRGQVQALMAGSAGPAIADKRP